MVWEVQLRELPKNSDMHSLARVQVSLGVDEPSFLKMASVSSDLRLENEMEVGKLTLLGERP
jgi:hypothetical protein